MTCILQDQGILEILSPKTTTPGGFSSPNQSSSCMTYAEAYSLREVFCEARVSACKQQEKRTEASAEVIIYELSADKKRRVGTEEEKGCFPQRSYC